MVWWHIIYLVTTEMKSEDVQQARGSTSVVEICAQGALLFKDVSGSNVYQRFMLYCKVLYKGMLREWGLILTMKDPIVDNLRIFSWMYISNFSIVVF